MSTRVSQSQAHQHWLLYGAGLLLAMHTFHLASLTRYLPRYEIFVTLPAMLAVWYPFLRFGRPGLVGSVVATLIVILVTCAFGMALCDSLWGGSDPLFQYPF
jgi:hypothetical protein